jgi:hypothetical protein
VTREASCVLVGLSPCLLYVFACVQHAQNEFLSAAADRTQYFKQTHNAYYEYIIERAVSGLNKSTRARQLEILLWTNYVLRRKWSRM